MNSNLEQEIEIVREMVNGYILGQAGPEEHLRIEGSSTYLAVPRDVLNVWYSYHYGGGSFNWSFSLHFPAAHTVYMSYWDERRKSQAKEFSISEPEMRSLQEEIRKRYDATRKEQGR